VKETNIIGIEMDTRRKVSGRNNSEGDGEKELEKYWRINRTRNMRGDSTFGMLEGMKGLLI